jgi:hypothetical protein
MVSYLGIAQPGREKSAGGIQLLVDVARAAQLIDETLLDELMRDGGNAR